MPAAASTVPYRTDGDLVALASRVVHGRVLSVRTEPGDSNRIYTVTRVAVLEDLTGVDESIVEVRELGGRIGIDEMFVAGTPGYVVGQEVLLLLERGPRGLRNVALSFSAFHVVPEGVTGAEAGVVRFAAGLEVLGERAESRRTRTLAEMRTIVGAVKGVQPVRPAGRRRDRRRPVRVEQPFTLLGSLALASGRQRHHGQLVSQHRSAASAHQRQHRHRDHDRGRGVDQPDDGQPDPGQRRHAQRRRLDRRVLHVGQRRRRPDQLRGSRGGRRVRACSRSAATAPAGRRRPSTARTSRASRTATWSSTRRRRSAPRYRVAPSFTRVLTHEIGHAIGLGHPCGGSGPTCTTPMQANLMYPSCCYAAMPLPPAIGPDDLAGLEFIYPQARRAAAAAAPPPPPAAPSR